MTSCRVCGAALGSPAYHAPKPAMTSIMTLVGEPTLVFVCEDCGHAQSPNLPDISAFYDTGYRISLASEDHDQIFSVTAAGEPIYRTAHQAAIGLDMLDLPQGARLLDYGAAKATTLRKMMRVRPDLRPAVFDVSADYAAFWDGWVPAEDQATYQVPAGWEGAFDAVMSHFVLEHVEAPVPFLTQICRLLRPGGQVLISVPDVAANPGDMIVADHLSHFSAPSLARALTDAGFGSVAFDTTSFPGAFFVTAKKVAAETAGVAGKDPSAAVGEAREICTFWTQAVRHVDAAAERLAGQRVAIYGAGFYGAWIASRLGSHMDVSVFLDQNPNLAGSTLHGRPVVPPAALPADVEAVFVGLNPKKARGIVAQVPALQRERLELVWLDA